MGATAKKAPTVQRDMEIVLAASATLKEQLKVILGGEENLDALTLRDAMEGETDLFEVIDKVALQIGEDESRATGITGLKRTLDARKQRLENRAETLRTMLLNALDMLGEPKLERPGTTISVRPIQPKLVVIEESTIHSSFWKPQDPVLDRAGLTDHLKARRAALNDIAAKVETQQINAADADAARAQVERQWPLVEGAELDNGGATVQLRFT